MAESKFQLSSGSTCDANQLPSNFIFLQLLGEGSYGKVLQCLKKDTIQIVAVKTPLAKEKNSTEVPMMEKLMLQKLDEQNIIQFLGWFPTNLGKAMVFESLDISLEEFILLRNCAPMPLSDVRDIIEQLAKAFNALKLIGVIHADLKLDNVMMVDHRRRPYGVKLIDFGVAFHRSKAQQGSTMQVAPYRAPEIILGLPFSEAIDMWSLGCVMAVMLHGGELFPGDTEYEVLQEINSLLGLPDDRVLDTGLKTKMHFNKTECGGWRLKTHHEYGSKQREYKPLTNTLDSFRKFRLDKGSTLEAVQRPMCIDLLEAMVKLDEAERITPSEILTHPFITSTGHSSNSTEKISFSRETKRPAHDPTELPPAVNLVCPPSAEKSLLLDIEGEDSEVNEEPPAALDKGDNMDIESSSPSLRDTPPGVILVQPASPENWLLLDIDEEDSEVNEEPPAALDKGDNMDIESSSPSLRDTPPGVILVQSASPENWLLLDIDEEDSEVNEEPPAALDKGDNMDIESSSPSPSDTPPGVILVQPASPENWLLLDIDEEDSEVNEEPPAAVDTEDNSETGSSSPSLRDTPPRPVQLLRTYTVERRMYTVESTVKDMTPSTHDFTRREKKKRKNCVCRFFSWMKKNLGSCFSSTDDDQDI